MCMHKITTCNDHRSSISAWHTDGDNKVIILIYKGGNAVKTKAYGISAMVTIQQQGISGVQ